jgi:uncharacterized protein (DUF885 family)
MTEHTKVARLAAELLDLIAEEDPLNDALEGYPHHADRLADLTEPAQRDLRDRAAAIAAAAGGGSDVDHAVVAQQAEALVIRVDARLVEHTMFGYDHSALGRLFGVLPAVRPVGTEQEHAFLRRLDSVPTFLEQAARRHRAGVAAGRTPVAERAAAAIRRVDGYLSAPGRDPFRDVPLSPDAAQRREQLLRQRVRPALAAYGEVLRHEVAPYGRASDRPGLCWVTGGEGTYAGLVRMHTTTGLDAERLHRIGLEQVERLAEQYAEIGEQAFGPTDADAVRQRLRTDPALRWRDAAEILSTARETVGRAERVAPGWFNHRPERPCVVAPAPDAAGPPAYYLSAALDGSRPGTYFASVSTPTERARYSAEATAFHEGVPGHHFQLSLAQGLDRLLPLRRLAWINSYVEGWGLYAERLADEMGLYSGPLARLGMVAQDSLRAARLVVDTGLHAFGWSRRRAVEYLLANTMLTETEAGGETDRYIEYPGQALSYLVGRLEFERLRAKAEKALAERFDIREFHDVVLGGGALPMDVLERVVDEWAGGRPV